MEWSDYYLSLERWVQDQYEHTQNIQKYLLGCLNQRQNFENANILARRKFEREMQALKAGEGSSIHSHGLSTAENSTQHAIRRCFNFPGIPEYRTIRHAHGWVKYEIMRSRFPMTRLERLFFASQPDTTDDLIDLNLFLAADQLGRFISATLEAILISRSFLGSGPGGATLGKWIMNLRVVSCEEVIPLPEFVEVIPGTDLGFCRALVRSILKGTSLLTFFSFLCMILFQYHRCNYDIIAGTLVVQPLPRSDYEDRADPPQQAEQ